MRRIRKAQITAFGGPERVDVVEAEIADPSPREVRLAVEVAEFSGADINMRRGTYPFQRKAPLTPGYSVVGRVESRGADARVLAAGDRVVALTIYGGEAELVNVAERDCYRVPAGVASEQAVCLILDWLTAYQMLHRAARVRRGQRLFVHGLSGAVGRGLLGLGIAAGAEVTGTASARYHDDLRSLGATPFSYDGKGWIDELRRDGGVDAVFDPLGFESFDESYENGVAPSERRSS